MTEAETIVAMLCATFLLVTVVTTGMMIWADRR